LLPVEWVGGDRFDCYGFRGKAPLEERNLAEAGRRLYCEMVIMDVLPTLSVEEVEKGILSGKA
jgi:hypothetical protein